MSLDSLDGPSATIRIAWRSSQTPRKAGCRACLSELTLLELCIGRSHGAPITPTCTLVHSKKLLGIAIQSPPKGFKHENIWGSSTDSYGSM